MRLSSVAALGCLAIPEVLAWGGFGHITIAYIASNFVQPQTATYFQTLLRNDTGDYLANVATWADSVRYSKWGRFTGVFHFIDAKDSPPDNCTVDLARDCKPEGCVVTAIQNYTAQVLDPALPAWRRAQAAKFVVHFVSDAHQPLHDEDVSRGGNGIHVLWDGAELNLHHVWDTRIPERWVGGVRRRRPYAEAAAWAANITREITRGGYAAQSKAWLDGVDFADPISTALGWAREGNAYVCSHVLPEGPEAIVGQELSGEYYEKAGPVIDLQVARAGFRLAAWLDLIVAALKPEDEL